MESIEVKDRILNAIECSRKRNLPAIYIGDVADDVKEYFSNEGYFVCDDFIYLKIKRNDREHIEELDNSYERTKYIRKIFVKEETYARITRDVLKKEDDALTKLYKEFIKNV